MKNLKNKYNSVPEGVKASVAYTVCSILQKAIGLITMPLFTRLLTAEQYGQHNLYQSWLSILTIFITFNMGYGSFPTAMMKYEHDRRGYIAAIQNITLVCAAIFLGLYFAFHSLFDGLFRLPQALILLMIVDILMQFAQLCWFSERRFAYKYKIVVAVTLLSVTVAPLLAFFLVSVSAEKGYARIIGYALVNIIIGLVIFVYSFVSGKGGMKKEYWKYALTFNVPLIPYYLSQVIFNESDRIMIDHLCGTDKAAMYSVAYTLATLLVFVLNAINNSYVPWFYGKVRDKKAEENKGMANGIALLMAFMLLGVIALTPEIIKILAAPAYYEAIWVVPPVAISILLLFYSQLFINVQFYYEEKMMLVWASIGAAVLNVVLNGLLIPVFGYVAAGYTTLLSYVVFAASNYIAVRHVAKKWEVSTEYFDLKGLMLILLGFAALAFTAMALYEHPIIRYSIIVTVFVIMGIMHKKLIVYIKSILGRK